MLSLFKIPKEKMNKRPEQLIVTPQIRAFEKKTELPMVILALLMLVTLVIPHFYTIPQQWILPLEIFDWFIWGAFALEFGYRIYLSPRKLAYIVRNWLDLAIVLLPALRVARLIRSLRLLRMFSVFYRRFKSLQSIGRRSRFDLLIIILAILMRPFALGTGVILVSLLIKEHVTDPLVQQITDKSIVVTLILFAGYILHRIIFKEMLVFAIHETAKRNEAYYDSIVIPIIKKLSPVVSVVLTILLLLQNLGFNITALSVMIGGVSFVLAFAMQETLSSVFAGIFLSIDSPFRVGDVIKIPDLGICEVKKFGIRAAELYVIENNTVIYIPNNQISSDKIINLSRPMPDIISRLTFNIAYETDIDKCSKIIMEILNSNPYIIGNPKIKVEAMKERVKALSKEKHRYNNELIQSNWGIKFWEAKEKFEYTYHLFISQLKNLTEEIEQFKKSGLSDQEKNSIRKSTAGLESLEEKLKKEYLNIYKVNQSDPKLQNPNTSAIEPYNLGKLSNRYLEKFSFFERRFHKLFLILKEIKEHNEMVLDNFITEFVLWLDNDFHSLSSTFEYPSVKISNFEESSLGITSKFYIWGIDLEKYRKIGRVEAEVKEAALMEFMKHKIEMPIPSQNIILKKG